MTALEAGQRWRQHPQSDRDLVQQVQQQAVGGIREVRSLSGHDNAIGEVIVSPDGKTLASSSADETAVLWDLETLQFDNLMAQGCDWLTTYLEYEEERQDELAVCQ